MGIDKNMLAEAIHCGFRKGSDCEQAHPIWKLISEMEPSDWDSYIEWVASSMEMEEPKVSKETANALEGLRNEIGANRTLVPKDDYNKGWNDGINAAIRFIRKYEKGEGLWQVTTK